jgi:tetratricopeptide (TPR) repeat protein
MAYRGLGELEKAKAHLRLQGTVGVRAGDPLFDELQEIVQGERLHLIRGRSALEAKRYGEAADEFRKAVAARPESVAGRVNLGAALNVLGDQRGAIEQFEEALRIAPENTNAHYNLGVLFVVQKRHAEAIPHLEFVLKSNPGDTATTIMLARLLATSPNYELRNGARALELAQGAYKATGSLEHGALISMALAELGRCSAALDWQRKLIEAAQRSEQISVAEKLKRDLQLYERSPCRPPG